MTRKDYELIAERIATAPLSSKDRQATALHFAKALGKGNSQFNDRLFTAAATRLPKGGRL
jgi:hypothetical protein